MIPTAATEDPASCAPPRGTLRPTDSLSLSQARRIALRAQGLDRPRRPRTGPVTMRQFQGVIDRVGLLQIDSVNVLARAHLMPVFSRLGPYDTALIDRASGRPPRRLVESWAHEASLVPPQTYALLGWRRRAYLDYAWGSIREVPLRYSPLVDDVLELITVEGPMTAREVHLRLDGAGPRDTDRWGWNWTAAKHVLEYLFFIGRVGSAWRNSQFERCYDLIERILPPQVLAAPEPDDADAIRQLVAIAARAHGVATERCLLDYFRIKGAAGHQAVMDLVEAGELVPVSVEGWPRSVLMYARAELPRRATGRALLSPFDPLVFERRRLRELFGLHYRIEIYVPEARREYGYYVLPFLHGEQPAALVDLKADRTAGVLRALAVHPVPPAEPASRRVRRSPGPQPDEVLADLAGELHLMAEWLGLDRVVVAENARGELAPALAVQLVRR